MAGRRYVGLVALALIAAACAQQPPERSPVPTLPETFTFPTVTTTTADPIPDDGTCYLVDSVGARVVTTTEGFAVADVLVSGDVITAIGGAPVTSQETLVGALSQYAPGDVIQLDYSRDGSPATASVMLGARPEEPTSPLLGVMTVPELDANAPAEVAAIGSIDPGDHIVFSDGEVFLVDPLAGSWRATGLAVPSGDLLIIEDRFYELDREQLPNLLPLDGGAPIVLADDGRQLLTALANVGDLILVALGIPASDSETSFSEIAVAATVPNSNDLLWSWQPREGQFLASPTFAFGSPDGSMALVSSQVDGTTVHTLISANGTLIAGFGTSEPVIPQGSFFSGWYDENSIAYTAPAADGLVVNVVSLETFTTSQVAAFAADQGLQQIWSVGDGQHLIAIGEPEAFLYEADASRRGRTLSRACDLSLRNGPVG